jgi:hypothetical protein
LSGSAQELSDALDTIAMETDMQEEMRNLESSGGWTLPNHVEYSGAA